MSEKVAQNLHISVLLAEVIDLIGAERGGTYLDATLGLGGHSEAILEKSPENRVIGIDQDENAIELAKVTLKRFGDRIRFFHANFAEIKNVLTDAGERSVDGILADLGVSSLQLDSEDRGFSFRFDSQLDMRMDQSSGDPTAAELLESLSEWEIADIIYRFGEERHSRRIAKRIVEKREAGTPLKTTADLASLVARSVPRSRKDRIHPATRTFQALRIAVNRETEILEQFIVDAIDSLRAEGRIAIITFHSLEDRIVKRTFQKMSGKCSCPPRIPQCVCGATKVIEILTRKPVTPGQTEIDINPRSRSAKLRVAKRI